MVNNAQLHRSNFLTPKLELSPKDRARYVMLFIYPTHWSRCLSSSAESTHPEFSGIENAYELLGVPENCSFDEIKGSFRKLAKETHPDLVSSSDTHAADSKRFVQILAAYEVKHMHWFQLGDEVSSCECRCTRARLPPSKFWLFEPRCCTHDIGGWYVETYGRNRKRKTVPSQRCWDGFDAHEESEKRLHPAVYLLALAYRTLDVENGRRTKRSLWDIAEGKLFKMFHRCKNLLRG